jgi:hypothetical protein
MYDSTCLSVDNASQLKKVLQMTVGNNHWATKLLTMATLHATDEPKVVKECMEELWAWFEGWIHKDPVQYLGVKAVIDAACKLEKHGWKTEAHKYFAEGSDNVPKYTPAYQYAMEGVHRCR